MADVSKAQLTAEKLEFRDDAALAALSAIALHEQPEQAAKMAYQYADAMVAARASGRGEA